MLDSYFEEVRRKQQKSLFFWFLVLIFAIFLFSFFKWKYISVNINWKQVISGSGTTFSQTGAAFSGSSNAHSQNSLISFHPFGIVNVKVLPKDSYISLNEALYINDSKPRVDYGEYQLKIERDGYISGEMNFEISDEKNFYIDDIALLKRPEYMLFPRVKDGRIINIGPNSWIGYSSSGMLLYQDSFLTGTLLQKNIFPSIGGDKFLSGATIVSYDSLTHTWSSEANRILNRFVDRCEAPLYKNGLYFCNDNGAVMTPDGKTLTGVIDSGSNFLKFENSVLLGDISSGNTKTFLLTGALSDASHFFEIDGSWYTFLNKKIIALDTKNLQIPPFDLELDSLEFVQNFGREMIFIGKKDEKRKLVMIRKWTTYLVRYLDFPDIEMADIRIYDKKWNFFIKARNALLFFYKESNDIEWLVDGKILAIGDTFALYEKEDGIWIADWNDKELKNNP